MAQDAVDHARFCNKGDDLHPGAAFADKRVNFKDFSEQARPGAPGFPRKVGIVLLRVGVCRGIGVVAIGARNGGSGPVRVGAIEALAMAPGIWNVRGDEEIVHEALGETFGLMRALEQQAAEHLHDSSR